MAKSDPAKIKFLTIHQIDSLLEAASSNEYPERDSALITLLFNHGLRVSEACDLRISQLDMKNGSLMVRRSKNGKSNAQPLFPDDLKTLRAWLKKRPSVATEHVFVSQKLTPMNRSTVWRIIKHAGEKAGLPISTHPHMLRHGCGYALVNKGYDTRLIQDWLGHSAIESTVVYTELDPSRFARIRGSEHIEEKSAINSIKIEKTILVIGF
jgi:type 1 fimbriae regulatory protein FimB